jgi:hypothetical protein
MLDKNYYNIVMKKSESTPFFPGRFNTRGFKKKRSPSIGLFGSERKPGSIKLFDIEEKPQDNSNVLNRKQSKCDLNFIDIQTNLIEDFYDLTNDNDVSLLLTLSMMCEIYIFHALLILQKEDPK